MVTWISALSKTRQRIGAAFSRVFRQSETFDEETLEELEDTLLQADVSMRLVTEWSEVLRTNYRGLDVDRREIITGLLRRSLGEPMQFDWPKAPLPFTLLLVGVNGTGKTTTAAKLAWRARQAGRSPLLAATDTFRAAGADQLRVWAERVPCDVVAGQQGADAAAVAFDAVAAAQARQLDAVIIDTAGRMHTKQPLMNELAKVRRSVTTKSGREPDATWIVLDASMGQNAIIQAKQFHATAPLTGAVVTKLDGSAKAGFLFSIVKELGVPIVFAGLGEGMQDLQPFDPDAFVEALVGGESEAR